MNYLAHAFLSFSEGQLAGNMIADFIRNSERGNYPQEIQNGIKLHRTIDSFTDSHPETHEAKKVFRPLVRLYSGAFVDVSFDYFLAKKLAENPNDFKKFTSKTYSTLWKYEEFLPENFQKMLVYMEKEDWLYNYQTEQGIKYSMQNVLNKAKYLDKDLPVFEAFLHNRDTLGLAFDRFFPELESSVKELWG